MARQYLGEVTRKHTIDLKITNSKEQPNLLCLEFFGRKKFNLEIEYPPY